MTQWIMWMAVAGVLVTLEIFSGTFYLLMIAVGAAAGAIAAYAGLDTPVQFLVAGVVGVGATIALNRSKLGKGSRVVAARDPNINLDVGQMITIDQWQHPVGGRSTARARYRGALWDVEYIGAGVAQAGVHEIREIRGSCLLVAMPSEKNHSQALSQPKR
ncbi:NfeD family protein [Actimicrobium sp. CCI2.3]|uniref:NfeD family protein n=1 Tax=Actimicrobium sp. CCI2.3 TaxID=3048616 RepID=UPI002AB34DFE|nr:NfeD family protein [Actimicrobium sp. CCI2.3]MDY7572814.1 NfeD family protein [Actimicrobium sp. CCI2.3]MEB0020659.1 NfeD family protein [Actimicrobium sp. CCI2.3]